MSAAHFGSGFSSCHLIADRKWLADNSTKKMECLCVKAVLLEMLCASTRLGRGWVRVTLCHRLGILERGTSETVKPNCYFHMTCFIRATDIEQLMFSIQGGFQVDDTACEWSPADHI